MGEWITTKIPLQLSKQIDGFLESKEGQMEGYPTKAQFIAESLREKLEKSGSLKPQLDRIERDLEFIQKKILDIGLSQVIESKLEESKLPKARFKSITASETVYDKFQEDYQKNKAYLTMEGVNSVSDYVPYVIREGMKRYKMLAKYTPKIEKISVADDRVILKDNIKNRIAEVVIVNKELFCQLCDEKDCVHCGFVFSLPDIYEVLNARGIKQAKGIKRSKIRKKIVQK